MLKILLLDCPDWLNEKLLREGFDVEAGTVGMCTGIRRLPSQVYEKDIFFYSPEQVSADVARDGCRDETPHFSLSKLESRIRAGATFVAFVNPLCKEVVQQNSLYSWIPFMPPLDSTHDKIVFATEFDSYPLTEFSALAPVVSIDELHLPLLVKLAPPRRNRDSYLPDVITLFCNGNGDCLGVAIMRERGRLILLPQFNSNSDVIETFLHRVVPKLYNVASHSGLIDLFRAPLERSASGELEELLSIEKQVRERQGSARSALAAATRHKTKVISNDATAKQILIYHDQARRQDDAALYYLYKIVEAIENNLGGESEGIKRIGAGTQWKAVKRLANESYRDARHAPKPSDVVKKWTHAEIKECFKNTETVVMAYFESLFRKESDTSTKVADNI
jgi:hypothetical protein